MSSDNKKSSIFGMSFYELQKQEQEKKQKKKQAEYMRKYNSKPEIQERKKLKRLNEKLSKEIKNLGLVDPHEICKKFGKTLAWSRRNPEYYIKCTKCEVSYSEKEKNHFFKKSHCPCCHLKLRMRKTIPQKRKDALEELIVQKKEQKVSQINQNEKNNELLIQEIKPLKKCPSCGKTVFTKDELETVFEFRKMGNKSRPQSWCRSCRTTNSK